MNFFNFLFKLTLLSFVVAFDKLIYSLIKLLVFQKPQDTFKIHSVPVPQFQELM